MSIVIKKIGGRTYAYEAYRTGDKVVQRYLGPADHPDILAHRRKIASEKKVPKQLFALFWDVDPGKLHIRRHGRYIIERILELGDLNALWWAQRQYPTSLIVETCRTSRRLSPRSKNFWSIWMGETNAA